MAFAFIGHPVTQAREETLDGVAVEAGELDDLNRRQVGGRAPQKTTENNLRVS